MRSKRILTLVFVAAGLAGRAGFADDGHVSGDDHRAPAPAKRAVQGNSRHATSASPRSDVVTDLLVDFTLSFLPPLDPSSWRHIVPFKVKPVPARLADVRTIAVIRSFEPRTYVVVDPDAPHVPSGRDPLAGAGDQGTPSAEEEKFTQSLKHGNAPISAILADDLAAQLTGLGYTARVEDGPWEITDDYSTLDFDKIKSSADAVLVVKPTITGFVASPDGRYQPTLVAIVTILGRDRNEVLYRGFHACGWQPMGDGWRRSGIQPLLESYAAMVAQPQKAAAGLAGAASGVAMTVADDLKSQSPRLARF